MSKKSYRFRSKNYVSGAKPKNWKCVAPLTYVSDVNVIEIDEDGSIIPTIFKRKKGYYSTENVLGTLSMSYKITKERSNLDEEWLKEKIENNFSKKFKYDDNRFIRDGSPIAYLSKIYMTKIDYIRIQREQKLKRILS